MSCLIMKFFFLFPLTFLFYLPLMLYRLNLLPFVVSCMSIWSLRNIFHVSPQFLCYLNNCLSSAITCILTCLYDQLWKFFHVPYLLKSCVTLISYLLLFCMFSSCVTSIFCVALVFCLIILSCHYQLRNFVLSPLILLFYVSHQILCHLNLFIFLPFIVLYDYCEIFASNFCIT